NLLKNAVKFSAPGGAVIVRTHNAPEDKNALFIEIADTGVGIEPEMLGKIFDPFFQEEHPGARRFGGLGLGLAIARNLVELQNGNIRAQSSGRDQGATFFIELPLAAASAARASDSSQPAAPNPAARRILLVEDHELTRTTLARLLRRLGHYVAVAATAAEARKLAGTKKCDLIISDLGLPDGDGHALVTELRERHGLPAIALSGYGMDEDLERSRKSGFFIHLVKPIDIHALRDAIAAAPPGEERVKS
ncbi:MAG TPA: ATP-binding protein, partial [Chthoniobacterales bacterium]|nr:ATP-binding protein [Chthoniobacterales bacterium]